MLETLRNAWKIKELRQKIIFTLSMLVVFRIGSFIPVPGLNPEALAEFFQGEDNLLGLLNVITGDALSNLSIFAMGIMPYINASIIMQLLTIVIPRLEELAKEGEEGKKKIAQITRYGTVVLATIQSIAMSLTFFAPAIENPTFFSYLTIVVSLTAGTAFLMWLGELISERGIGNGISLIIFAGIIAGFPSGVAILYETVRVGEASIFLAILILLVLLALIVGIITLEEGQRRVPVQYAKRVVGRKMYGGQSTHIPMKINQSGVIPVIFASALLMFPLMIASFIQVPFMQTIAGALEFGKPLNTILYALLIVFFAFFYTAIQFDPIKIANDMKKNGGFIPGLRPGRPTAEYLGKVSFRLTIAGALALAGIAVLPILFQNATRVNMLFTGTGLIIVVGVALETMKQIESQMLMRSYQGFMK